MEPKFKKEALTKLKYKPSLIDSKFKEDLARLLTLGAAKYEKENWRLASEDQVIEYRDALERHLLARDNGEYIDNDTGIPHSICIAFNSMAIYCFDKKYKDIETDTTLWENRTHYYEDIKSAK